jgi:hypothetical protein
MALFDEVALERHQLADPRDNTYSNKIEIIPGGAPQSRVDDTVILRTIECNRSSLNFY